MSVAKIYYYAVSLVTIIMIIFFMIQLVNNIVNYVYPLADVDIPQSDADLRREMAYEKYGYELSEKEVNKKAKEFSQEEVEEYKKSKKQEMIKMERSSALRNILYDILAIIVTVPFYLFHFRQAKLLFSEPGR